MSANRELDYLLHRLRLDTPACFLDDVEQGVWQRIAGRETQIQRAGVGLPFVVASVVAAFVWGIFTGVDVTTASAASPGLLVEEVVLLPPDLGSLQP